MRYDNPLMKNLLIFIFCLCNLCVFAQKEGNIWYFGTNAGLDFNSGKPIALSDGMMNTREGCATICNKFGKLLFYTDGTYVWTRAHKTMPNGTALNGNSTTTQSAIIVPAPGDTNKYYIFTADFQAGAKGVCYSIVDMTLNGGYGDVSTLNVLLYKPSCEKITAIPCADANGYWILSHGWGNNSFIAYKLTKSGVSTTTIVSKIGPVVTGTNDQTIGYMIASPDAKKIGIAHTFLNDIEVLDFDNNTGIVSNMVQLTSKGQEYGVAFSANSKMLYISNAIAKQVPPVKHIVQYDLTASNIPNSAYEITTDDSSIYGALSLAPDGKIYIARYMTGFLDAINSPGSAGAACNYVRAAVRLAPNTNNILGLPNFVSSIFISNKIEYSLSCNYGLVHFKRSQENVVDSLIWDFGEPSSGLNNSAHKDSASHKYTKAGTYKVRLVIYYKGNIDSISTDITLLPKETLNLGNDTSVCRKDNFYLKLPKSFNSTSWQDGSTAANFLIKQSGVYWVSAVKDNCPFSDTIKVSVIPNVVPVKTLDTIICKGQQFNKDYSQAGCTYMWQDGSQLPQITTSSPGIYTIKVRNTCNAVVDTIKITALKPLKYNLGNDTTLCNGVTLQLQGPDSSVYLWQDGSLTRNYTVSKTGKYRLKATNVCGTVADSIQVQYNSKYKSLIPTDTTLCVGDSFMLNAYSIPGKYSWSNGTQGSKANLKGGPYILTFKNTCEMVSDTITIKTDSFCNCYLYAPDIFSPDNNGINESWKPSSCTHYKSYLLQVYDRWGERVFTTNNLNEGWDGKFRGKDAMEGMYIYLIKLVDVHNSNAYKSGRFYLIRD